MRAKPKLEAFTPRAMPEISSAEPTGARSQRVADASSTETSPLERIPLKFIRFRAVRDRTGLSRSTIWRLERLGALPKHHRISLNAVAWVEQDVFDWMRAKASTR